MRCHKVQATYPNARRAASMRSVWSCYQWGLACCALLPTARCALTAPFHPCLCALRHRRSCSLRHFPSCYHAQPLAGIVLCVARTFLPVLPRGGCLFCLRGGLYKVSLVSGSLKSAAKPEPRNHCADLDGWATIRHLVLPIHPANGPAWFSGCLNFLTFIGRLSNRFYVT